MLSPGGRNVDEESLTGRMGLSPRPMDTWVKTQRKAFTNWVNFILARGGVEPIKDLEKDLQDGVKLVRLAEILRGKPSSKKPKEGKVTLKVHKISNINIALDMFKEAPVNITIGAEQVFEGDLKMILGLVWMLIQRFQIGEGDEEEGSMGEGHTGPKKSAKEQILEWLREYLKDYPVVLDPFPKTFQDGKIFQYMVHRKDPRMIDYNAIEGKTAVQRMNEAFDQANTFGVPKLLDAEDVAKQPEELSILTYLSTFRSKLGEVASIDEVHRSMQGGTISSHVITEVEVHHEEENAEYLQMQEQLRSARQALKDSEDRNSELQMTLESERKSRLREERTSTTTTKVQPSNIEAEVEELRKLLEKNRKDSEDQRSALESELRNLRSQMSSKEAEEQQMHQLNLELEELRRQKKESERRRGEMDSKVKEMQNNIDTLKSEQKKADDDKARQLAGKPKTKDQIRKETEEDKKTMSELEQRIAKLREQVAITEDQMKRIPTSEDRRGRALAAREKREKDGGKSGLTGQPVGKGGPTGQAGIQQGGKGAPGKTPAELRGTKGQGTIKSGYEESGTLGEGHVQYPEYTLESLVYPEDIQQVEDLQTKVRDLESDLQKEMEQRRLLEDRLNKRKNENEGLLHAIMIDPKSQDPTEELQIELKNAIKENDQLRARAGAAGKSGEELKQRLDDDARKLDDELRKLLDDLRRQLADAMKENQKLQQRADRLNDDVEGLNGEMDEMRKKLAEEMRENDLLRAQLDDLKKGKARITITMGTQGLPKELTDSKMRLKQMMESTTTQVMVAESEDVRTRAPKDSKGGDLKAKLDETTRQLLEAQKRLDDQERALKALQDKDGEIARLKERIAELERELQEARKLADKRADENLRSVPAAATLELTELKRELDDRKKSLDDRTRELETEKVHKEQVLKELEIERQKLIEIEKKGPTVMHAGDYPDEKDQHIADLEREIADLKKQLRGMEVGGQDRGLDTRERDALKHENEELITELNRLNEENARLNEENARLRDENDRLLEENDALRAEAVALAEKNDSLEDEVAKLDDENKKLNDEAIKLNALTSDTTRSRKIRINIERLIRKYYYHKGLRMSERAAWRYLKDVHEADEHIQDYCGVLKDRIKKIIDMHNKSMQDVHEGGRRGPIELENEIEQLRKWRRELKEIKERWVKEYNTLGDLYRPKTSGEVDAEEMRRRLVTLADNPGKLESEKNLEGLIESAVQLLTRDSESLEEVFKQKPNRRETRKDVEQEITRLSEKIDDQYAKEVYRLRDYILNKNREDEEETESRSGVVDPTVVEYMIMHYNDLFEELKKDARTKEVHQLVSLPVDYIRRNAADEPDLLLKENYKPYAVNQIKNYAYRGYNIDLSQVKDPFVVAGLLKDYFKELKEPLLTYKLYNRFMDVGEMPEGKAMLKDLRALISLLPPMRRATLTVLIGLLYKLASNESRNNMSVSTLASVFTPLILRPEDDGRK